MFPYEVFVTSSNSGLLEFVPDTVSIDGLKKKFPSKDWNLKTFFDKYYEDEFQDARKCFVESLAGYSLYTYIFSVKDRHNGNILVDEAGHLIHIDFGFIFDWSPGRDMRFESANFKLTKEFVKILGGNDKAEAYQLYV